MELSIIMGTYNGSKTIYKAIESILKQTYQNFELIICDDFSTDNTVEIINRYKSQDNRIKLITNSENLGLAASLNRCIQLAQGELIGRMDDDDVCYPNKFEKQIKYIKENPQYSIVGTNISFFDEKTIWGQRLMIKNPTLKEIFKGISFVHPTVIMKKKDLHSIGNYTENAFTRRGQDYDLWCKFYHAGYIGSNIEETLFFYYESKNSVKKRKFIYRYNVYKQKKYWRKKFSLPLYYDIYAYKELIASLVPKQVLLLRRKLITN